MVPLQGVAIRKGWTWRSATWVPFLLSTPLLVVLHPIQLAVGVCLALLVIGLPVPRRAPLAWLQGLAAIGVAVVFGFRISFLSDPHGGVLALGALGIPFTLLWGIAVLGLREVLRSAPPRPALQLSIDLLLVADAFLLALVFPQAHAVVLARALPLLLLGIVIWGALFARGSHLLAVHRSVALGLILFGISGMTKGAVSLFLVAPLAVIGLPMMTASPAFFASGAVSARSVPRGLARFRVTQGRFALAYVVAVSAFVLGGVVAAYHSTPLGLLALLAVPLILAGHRAWPTLARWLSRVRVEQGGGRVRLLGVTFDRVSLAGAVARVEQMLDDPACSHTIVTPNSLSVLRARRDASLRSAYARADLVLPDGIGVVWASQWLRAPLPERVTGIDLAEGILQRAGRSGIRVFLLGGRPGVAHRAARRLCTRFPGVSIVGVHNGYFSDVGAIARTIQAAAPDLLFVGMGVPRQERVMVRLAGVQRIPVMIGLGGALDVFAGDRVRAPRAWRRLGLEWLHRILQEPRRIGAAWGILRFIFGAVAVRAILLLQDLLALSSES
jgi:N-acetylglucosaminyldiphosphoundecaprenol N-acetyl-beta-D-mannosaminyltransferase